MSAPILTVTHLSASIAGQQVVEDVSFEVPATGITAVLGRNGVGKTSTMRAILGLISRRGDVTLAGERSDALPALRAGGIFRGKREKRHENRPCGENVDRRHLIEVRLALVTPSLTSHLNLQKMQPT